MTSKRITCLSLYVFDLNEWFNLVCKTLLHKLNITTTSITYKFWICIIIEQRKLVFAITTHQIQSTLLLYICSYLIGLLFCMQSTDWLVDLYEVTWLVGRFCMQLPDLLVVLYSVTWLVDRFDKLRHWLFENYVVEERKMSKYWQKS